MLKKLQLNCSVHFSFSFFSPLLFHIYQLMLSVRYVYKWKYISHTVSASVAYCSIHNLISDFTHIYTRKVAALNNSLDQPIFGTYYLPCADCYSAPSSHDLPIPLGITDAIMPLHTQDYSKVLSIGSDKPINETYRFESGCLFVRWVVVLCIFIKKTPFYYVIRSFVRLL